MDCLLFLRVLVVCFDLFLYVISGNSVEKNAFFQVTGGWEFAIFSSQNGIQNSLAYLQTEFWKMLFLELSWNIHLTDQELQTHPMAISLRNTQNHFRTYFIDPIITSRYCDFQMLLGDCTRAKNSMQKSTLVEVHAFQSSLSSLDLPFHLKNFDHMCKQMRVELPAQIRLSGLAVKRVTVSSWFLGPNALLLTQISSL